MRNLLIVPALLFLVAACGVVPDFLRPVSSHLTPPEIEALGSVRSQLDLARADLNVKLGQFTEYAAQPPCSAARVTLCSTAQVVADGADLFEEITAALDAADLFLDPVSGLPNLSGAAAKLQVARLLINQVAALVAARDARLLHHHGPPAVALVAARGGVPWRR